MKIGIIIADDVEFEPFVIKAREMQDFKEYTLASCRTISFNFKNKHEVFVIYCGIGKANAASGVTALILNGAQAIICAGLSGAISGVRKNEFVVGDRYIQADVDMTAIGFELFKFPSQDVVTKGDERLVDLCLKAVNNCVSGMIGSGDYFLADTVKKNYFKDSVGLTAFDMESAANSAICQKNGVPFVALRLISDDADDCAVENYRDSFEYLEKQELTDAVLSVIDLM